MIFPIITSVKSMVLFLWNYRHYLRIPPQKVSRLLVCEKMKMFMKLTKSQVRELEAMTAGIEISIMLINLVHYAPKSVLNNNNKKQQKKPHNFVYSNIPADRGWQKTPTLEYHQITTFIHIKYCDIFLMTPWKHFTLDCHLYRPVSLPFHT